MSLLPAVAHHTGLQQREEKGNPDSTQEGTVQQTINTEHISYLTFSIRTSHIKGNRYSNFF